MRNPLQPVGRSILIIIKCTNLYTSVLSNVIFTRDERVWPTRDVAMTRLATRWLEGRLGKSEEELKITWVSLTESEELRVKLLGRIKETGSVEVLEYVREMLWFCDKEKTAPSDGETSCTARVKEGRVIISEFEVRGIWANVSSMTCNTLQKRKSKIN